MVTETAPPTGDFGWQLFRWPVRALDRRHPLFIAPELFDGKHATAATSMPSGSYYMLLTGQARTRRVLNEMAMRTAPIAFPTSKK